MENKKNSVVSSSVWSLIIMLLISSLLVAVSAALVTAETTAVTLEVSKSASADTVLAGETFEYTIVLTATGDEFVSFNLTDTLPANVTYVPDSLSVDGGITINQSGDTFTATGQALNSGNTAMITFEVTASASAVTGTEVINTVDVDDLTNASMLSDTAAVTILTATIPSTYYINLPILAVNIPGPILSDITGPSGGTNEWTINWSDLHSSIDVVTGYEIQEATDAAFTTDLTTTSVGLVTELSIDKADDLALTTFYYRVRAISSNTWNSNGAWSNVESVSSSFNYEDTFSDTSNPTDWHIVRQDTDTVVNEVSISETSPGYLDLRMESGFDYMIVSDLTELPDGGYTLVARMRLEDADPRHAGGIILGADYNGSSDCPISTTDYSSCFTEYYRFMFIAGNLSNEMDIQIKRIESHSEDSNSGSGATLASSTVTLGGTRSDWIEWTIEVSDSGQMVLKLDGTTIHTVTDTTYQDNNYFGFWSSTSDTTFSNTQIDWVTINQN